ncbi:MAG: LemA family protein [Acidobacteria bacterium]|nr:LemA family protein [Acidobacteriota bacterium]
MKGKALFGLGCGVVLLIGVALVLLLGVGGYNHLVTLSEQTDAAWGQVENVYQRRADLVPNLVATVKGAASFERETFEAVTEARAKVGQVQFNGAPTPEQMASFQQAQDSLSSALSRLLVVVEKYPELKATEAFRDLQSQLEGAENRIAVERRRFNEAAQAYNTARKTFPTIVVANFMGFGEKPYFKSQEGADRAPEVKF